MSLPAAHLPNPQTENVMVLDFYNTAEDIKAAFDDCSYGPPEEEN